MKPLLLTLILVASPALAGEPSIPEPTVNPVTDPIKYPMLPGELAGEWKERVKILKCRETWISIGQLSPPMERQFQMELDYRKATCAARVAAAKQGAEGVSVVPPTAP